MAARATGRVLDLGGADAHSSLWDSIPGVDGVESVAGTGDPALLRLARGAERFDTVFSVFQFAAASDLEATLDRVATLLSDDGRVLFLEPARRVGMSGRAQRLVAPAVGLTTGWKVGRDIPVALRQAGLSVISLDRHRVTTMQWWLAHLVEGVAHHASPIAHPDA